MKIKGIIDEDFVNYKKPSMVIISNSCSFKCEKENGESCCQNSSLSQIKSKDILDEAIIVRYINNPITKAIVFSGLEPLDQFNELFDFILKLRYQCNCSDPVVIYSGFKEEEVVNKTKILSGFENIIVKFGRFIPNQKPHFDDILGVNLASDNQYAKKISI